MPRRPSCSIVEWPKRNCFVPITRRVPGPSNSRAPSTAMNRSRTPSSKHSTRSARSASRSFATSVTETSNTSDRKLDTSKRRPTNSDSRVTTGWRTAGKTYSSVVSCAISVSSGTSFPSKTVGAEPVRTPIDWIRKSRCLLTRRGETQRTCSNSARARRCDRRVPRRRDDHRGPRTQPCGACGGARQAVADAWLARADEQPAE